MSLMQGWRRWITVVIVVCAVLAVPVAHAEYKAWVLATFDDTPEGLAVDAKGNIYTALFHTGRIIKITPDGTQELIAIVP